MTTKTNNETPRMGYGESRMKNLIATKKTADKKATAYLYEYKGEFSIIICEKTLQTFKIAIPKGKKPLSFFKSL